MGKKKPPTDEEVFRDVQERYVIPRSPLLSDIELVSVPEALSVIGPMQPTFPLLIKPDGVDSWDKEIRKAGDDFTVAEWPDDWLAVWGQKKAAFDPDYPYTPERNAVRRAVDALLRLIDMSDVRAVATWVETPPSCAVPIRMTGEAVRLSWTVSSDQKLILATSSYVQRTAIFVSKEDLDKLTPEQVRSVTLPDKRPRSEDPNKRRVLDAACCVALSGEKVTASAVRGLLPDVSTQQGKPYSFGENGGTMPKKVFDEQLKRVSKWYESYLKKEETPDLGKKSDI